ncbi:MAG: hypothetical protein SO150_03400 [Faecalicoccus sp.]|uniref:hypothetical protein n=1 Tax=Faecalicoccus sp. TaxID=1971758 RepID=UPI002A7EE91E|nr:hypothetical protein [Faecalicoccus sp.]MDY4869372.1 hypothetical protein [Faecalicoccus sp.]MDY5232753.1 hypothetical protein [Faecalicoccus sp.]
MEYHEMYNQLMMIKKNPMGMSMKQRVTLLITTVGEFPDALELYKNTFLNEKQAEELIRNGINGWAATQHILSKCEIRTPNSTELSYKYYGYVRPITPRLLDQFIDMVANRVQLEKEYGGAAYLDAPKNEKEDELTLQELEHMW